MDFRPLPHSHQAGVRRTTRERARLLTRSCLAGTLQEGASDTERRIEQGGIAPGDRTSRAPLRRAARIRACRCRHSQAFGGEGRDAASLLLLKTHRRAALREHSGKLGPLASSVYGHNAGVGGIHSRHVMARPRLFFGSASLRGAERRADRRNDHRQRGHDSQRERSHVPKPRRERTICVHRFTLPCPARIVNSAAMLGRAGNNRRQAVF